MDQKKIGGFLKEERKRSGLTQEQVAEKLGISSRTISRWETGAYMPDISLLVNIAEMYDLDVREIIDGERKEDNMNSEVKEVAVKMADYSAIEKKNILNWIKLMSMASMIVSICVIILNGVKVFFLRDAMSVGRVLANTFFNANSILAYILFAFSLIVMLYAKGKFQQMEQSKAAMTVVKIIIVIAIILSVFAIAQTVAANYQFYVVSDKIVR